MIKYFCLVFCILELVQGDFDTPGRVNVSFSFRQVNLEVGSSATLLISFDDALSNDTVLVFTYEQDGGITYNQSRVVISPLPDLIVKAGQQNATVLINATLPGNVILGINSSSDEIAPASEKEAYVKIGVIHSNVLYYIIIVVGWIYFAAWSISFYPQVFLNCSRKSVTGLNFDFLGLNITGFIYYAIFNVGFYFIPKIQEQYLSENPRSVIPVELNDVVFALHAVAITALTIIQCLVFERGGQRVSRLFAAVLVLIWLAGVVLVFVAVGGGISWLMFIYILSYIKLGITFMKYFPQAVMNWRRKSTRGWSIYNILLDLTGGTFSLLQMFLIAYNYDNWQEIFGNITKLGLGLFSIAFDMVFIMQHYCLYRTVRDGSHTPFLKEDDDSPPA